MFCHGTQIIDNSRICHCLLFHEHGKQNFVQPFRRLRKLLRYTHSWTKLHKFMSWISGGAVYIRVIMHGLYLKRTQLLCVIWRYHLWAACLSWFAVALSSAWSSQNRNLFYHVCKFETRSLNLNFRYMATQRTVDFNCVRTHAALRACTCVAQANCVTGT